MKAIIFGAGGQDGYYLAQILEREGVKVHAFTRKECDVGVQGYVCHQIAQIQPDYVFNLAAQSSTSHDALWPNQRAIVDGAVNILDAVKNYCPKAKVWLAGSILQLSGRHDVAEFEQVNGSAYAAQRNASVAYARYYRRIGVQVYVGYLSHHDSPRRGKNHLAKRLATEVVELMSGKRRFLEVNDLLDQKEWNFAGDMMEAVWHQVNTQCYEAVLGSGKTDTIQNYLVACMAEAGSMNSLACVKTETTRDEPLVTRTNDGRFEHHFKTTLRELARMMVQSVDCKSGEHPERIGS